MNTVEIEDIFPLTAMQRAVLLHSLSNPDADSGLLQIQIQLSGPLRIEVFREAWHRVIQRHSGLRSSAHWEDVDEPVQVVLRDVDLPWFEENWPANVGANGQKSKAELLERDRERGVDLTRAPALRVTVASSQTQRTFVLLTGHHLFLDGWSGAIMLKEVFDFYELLCEGRRPSGAPPVQFSKYAAWLRTHQGSAEEEFWQKYLQGYRSPVRSLVTRRIADESPDHGVTRQVDLTIGGESTQSLRTMMLSRGLTAASLFQTVWATALGRNLQSDDIVFAMTVSGRDIDLVGVESIVGLLMNVMLCRVPLEPSMPLFECIRGVQVGQDQARLHGHISMDNILDGARRAGIRVHPESLLVVENYPAGGLDGRRTVQGLEVSGIVGDFTSAFPVTLMVSMRQDLRLQLLYDPSRLNYRAAEILLEDLGKLLECMAVGSIRTVGEALEVVQDQGRNSGVFLCPKNQDSPASRQTALRSPLETTLVQIWQDALDLESISVTDDFFELGGGSLSAIDIFSSIESTLGRKLPLTAIQQAPTVEAMADLLQVDGWNFESTSLVPIQRGDSRPAVFCMHGALGTFYSRYYRDLARAIGPDRTFFGLQSSGHDRIESMAAHYASEIRSMQPSGPYLLMGNCTGGLIAYEVSRLLSDANQDVGLVAMIDTVHPRLVGLRNRSKWKARVSQAGIYLRKGDFLTPARKALDRGARKRRLGTAKSNQIEREISTLARTIDNAAKQYRPATVVPWNLDFFWASKSRGFARYNSKRDVRRRWGRWTTGQVEIHDLQCFHSEALADESLAGIAERVRERIQT